MSSNSERLQRTTARDVMTSPVIYVMTETPLREIASVMLRERISAVPVVAGGGQLVGMVSEGDLVQRRSGDRGARRSWWLDLFEADAAHSEDFLEYLRRHGLRAKDVMTGDVITVEEGTPIARVAELLDSNRIKRVPVLREGRIIGIVSRADLLRALACAPVGPPSRG
jgi:CBS domain-containing protein